MIADHSVNLTIHGEDDFGRRVADECVAPLRGATIETVQVNIGLRCNLACRHCHVESSPKRTEEMDWPTMELVLETIRRAGASILDITGGAPEMNPNFRRLVAAARAMDVNVIVRTNLTIMLEDGHRDDPEFFAEHRVRLIASLPCYLKKNVERQRGLHVFDESIEVIRRLNGVGHGAGDALPLDLVFNPQGPSLPPPQAQLEDDYREILRREFGIEFRHLIAITNLPIGRFQHDLDRDGRGERYRQLLRDSFNPQTLDGLMCRHQLHVGHDGTLHDCDFNYALKLPSRGRDGGRPWHIRDFDPQQWRTRRIVTGTHCFGCTAGSGSSCGGAIVNETKSTEPANCDRASTFSEKAALAHPAAQRNCS